MLRNLEKFWVYLDFKKNQLRDLENFCFLGKKMFFKIALNGVLIADSQSTRKLVPNATGIIDFENKNISIVQEQWKIIISAPMSYIAFLERT